MVNMDQRKKIQIKSKFNLKEFLEFVKDKEERYELIDGKIYLMAAPAIDHQRITGTIYRKLGNYLEGKTCEVFIAPFDVFLFEKNKKDNCQNVFQPDVFVVCDEKKKSQRGINGAPDFIIEIVSPSNEEYDYILKFNMYMQYGVKEYWIVNPMTRQISVYVKQKNKSLKVYTYSFNDTIKVSIFDDFEIDFKELQI